MLNQINSEWIKLKSVRSNIVLLIIAVAINVLVTALISIFGDANSDADLLSLLPGQFIATLFFLVAGVQIIGQEYRFSTIRTTFSVSPNRIKVIFAKLTVLAATVGTATLSLVVLSGLLGKLIFSIRGTDLIIGSSDLKTVGYLILGNIICGFFGFGVSAIVRNPIAGIVIVLVWPTIGETVVQGIASAVSENFYIAVAKWLPFLNFSLTLADDNDPNFLSRPFGLLYFFAVASVFVALGSALVKKRDA